MDDKRAVLVVPVAFVTDHIETAYELDVEVREEAKEFGITHYEVTSGLNDHPEFIAALAESTAAQLRHNGGPLLSGFPPCDERPRHPDAERTLRCEQCRSVGEACLWPSVEIV